ncbi:MAG: hypothetical protein PHQ81_07520 [Methanofollis sp.]|nr:hypothetical protein [Methanofollis sp.]
MRKELAEKVRGDVEEYFDGIVYDCSSSECSLDMDDFNEDGLIQIVERDIDEKFNGTTVSETDILKMKKGCKRALLIFCKELYQMDSYENFA